MAEFIDIACNFTHPSLKENLDEIMLNAENVGVKKFVLVSSNLSDLKPIEELKSINQRLSFGKLQNSLSP